MPDEFDLDQEDGESQESLAYPGRLTIFKRGNKTELPVIIRGLSTSGASVEFDIGYLHNLPGEMAEHRVRIECPATGGESFLLVGKVKFMRRRGKDNRALAWVSLDPLSLAQVNEIQALLAAPNKDHRMLWGLWESLDRGEVS